MPKKHHKNTFAKPISTPHHSLASSSLRSSQNDPFRAPATAAPAEQPSVNDLINHLRRTQVSPSSPDGNRIPQYVTPRTVHPSLRNLLDIPETPPPRPRPDARRTGIVGRRLRRTAGPPPPASWLSGNTTGDEARNTELDDTETGRVIYRLERLPGTKFPSERSFVHILLKSMAGQWAWHVAYDGQFLGLLPTHIKMLLLSYVGYYARDQPLAGLVRGLKPLFVNTGSPDGSGHDRATESDAEVTHLDLSGAVGRWISLKQLSTELFLQKKKTLAETDATNSVPQSWEDDYEENPDPSSNNTIPKALQPLRFQNLQHLSLAHPHPASASWTSLINLLSRLSTITHLSLAHWPVPTSTPNALNAKIRPSQGGPGISYSGTDAYAALENNWAEAASILRRLARVTYCLKWLDLEGCGDWIPALHWEAQAATGGRRTFGPEWNGAWRDIEYIRLGPGWLPDLDEENDLVTFTSIPTGIPPAPSSTPQSRALTFSIHAPPPRTMADLPTREAQPPTEPKSLQTWDVEVERRKYRRAKELVNYRDSIRAAKAVQRRILQTRKDGRGKWVNFSFGLEGLEEDLLVRMLGEGLRREFF